MSLGQQLTQYDQTLRSLYSPKTAFGNTEILKIVNKINELKKQQELAAECGRCDEDGFIEEECGECDGTGTVQNNCNHDE